MRTILRIVMVCLPIVCLLVPAGVTLAQEKPAAATRKIRSVRGTKRPMPGVKDILLRSALKMPEENYNFKPTDAVRSYGQIVGHVADAQYLFCSSRCSRRRIPRWTSSTPKHPKRI